FSDASRVRSHVHRLAPEIEQEVISCVERIRVAKEQAISDLENSTATSSPLAESTIAATLSALSERTDASVKQIEGDKTAEAILPLEEEKSVLYHRKVLAQFLPQVEEFVESAKWTEKAARCRSSLNTRPVTDMEKTMSQQI